MNKLSNFMKIADAAEYLGVCPNTLRNWESAGKILAHRHPVNGYRLFKKEQLDELLLRAEKPSPTAEPIRARPR